MSNNSYDVYVDQTLSLVQSLVIKSEDGADGINKYLQGIYGVGMVDTTNPKSWKYYLNLSGQPHQVDVPMYVTSLDTLETIQFTRANLDEHLATARAYRFGTRYYRELITMYPSQELLINGILRPVAIDAAIAAKDGEVLYWDPVLVEENEYSLIQNINTWIAAYKLRNENKQFAISDDLYLTVSHAVMYMLMVPAVMEMRLKMCRTIEAHSFHVKQYLASHNGLDKYFDFMTVRQRLFLYRNINYIQRHAGSNETLLLLVEKILTARNIPISFYTMRHNVKDLLTTLDVDVTLRKKPLNMGRNSTTYDLLTLNEGYDKENDLARENEVYRDEYLDIARERLSRSTSNVVLTKMLESTMVDYTDSTMYKLNEILLSHWLFHSVHNYYRAVVSCNNPATGERYSLKALESFILMMYCFFKANNLDVEYIPPLTATHVQRLDFLTTKKMLRVVDRKFWPNVTDLLDSIRKTRPAVGRVISIQAFYNQTYKIYQHINLQRDIIATVGHMDMRAQVESATKQLYTDWVHYPAEQVRFRDWLAERNINLDKLQREDYETMYTDLFNEGTGLNLVSKQSLKDIQKAMIAIVETLSSYSVQFVGNITAENLIQLDPAAARIGDINTTAHIQQEVHSSNVHALKVDSRTFEVVELDVDRDGDDITWAQQAGNALDYNIPTLLEPGTVHFKDLHTLEIPIDVNVEADGVVIKNGDMIFPGSQYMAMLDDDTVIDLHQAFISRRK